ncbi:DUF397 domain-containing protein [Streptomyces sp. NPDC002536]
MSSTPHSIRGCSAWFKSSYSNGSGGECLEAAPSGVGTIVRDSKYPGSPVLAFHRAAWTGFVNSIRSGELG